MQVVSYPSLGSTESGEYIKTSISILKKIKRDGPQEKALKRWMRGQSIFDKERFGLLKELLDIHVGEDGVVSLGNFGAELLETGSLEGQQDLIFEKIAAANEILIKYVFDALQERLYSTSELYRMLTSYVYPGKEIDLPDFNLWLKWMEATGRVRILGIRWAPGKRFEECASYIKSIDVDEILEDEAEDLLRADGETPEEAAEPAPAPVEVEVEVEVARDPAVGWEPPEDDEVPAAKAAPAPEPQTPPAEAPPPRAEREAPPVLAGSPSHRAQGPIEARLLSPAPALSVLAAGAPLEMVRASLEAQPRGGQDWGEGLEPGQEALAENVRHLGQWWAGRAQRQSLRSDQHGIMPHAEDGWGEGTRGRFVFRLACLGVSLLRGQPDGDVAFAVLDGADFYGQLFDNPGSVERLLDELFEQGLGARSGLFGDLHLVLMLARSLRGSEGWCKSLEDMDTDALLAALWQRLAAFQLHEEVLWIAREMSIFGLWRQEGLKALRVVPTDEVRRMAFHLGFVESARASTLPNLIALSRRLTPLMGPQLEGPLLGLWREYGARPPHRFWTR